MKKLILQEYNEIKALVDELEKHTIAARWKNKPLRKKIAGSKPEAAVLNDLPNYYLPYATDNFYTKNVIYKLYDIKQNLEIVKRKMQELPNERKRLRRVQEPLNIINKVLDKIKAIKFHGNIRNHGYNLKCSRKPYKFYYSLTTIIIAARFNYSERYFYFISSHLTSDAYAILLQELYYKRHIREFKWIFFGLIKINGKLSLDILKKRLPDENILSLCLSDPLYLPFFEKIAGIQTDKTIRLETIFLDSDLFTSFLDQYGFRVPDPEAVTTLKYLLNKFRKQLARVFENVNFKTKFEYESKRLHFLITGSNEGAKIDISDITTSNVTEIAYGLFYALLNHAPSYDALCDPARQANKLTAVEKKLFEAPPIKNAIIANFNSSGVGYLDSFIKNNFHARTESFLHIFHVIIESLILSNNSIQLTSLLSYLGNHTPEILGSYLEGYADALLLLISNDTISKEIFLIINKPYKKKNFSEKAISTSFSSMNYEKATIFLKKYTKDDWIYPNAQHRILINKLVSENNYDCLKAIIEKSKYQILDFILLGKFKTHSHQGDNEYVLLDKKEHFFLNSILKKPISKILVLVMAKRFRESTYLKFVSENPDYNALLQTKISRDPQCVYDEFSIAELESVDLYKPHEANDTLNEFTSLSIHLKGAEILIDSTKLDVRAKKYFKIIMQLPHNLLSKIPYLIWVNSLVEVDKIVFNKIDTKTTKLSLPGFKKFTEKLTTLILSKLLNNVSNDWGQITNKAWYKELYQELISIFNDNLTLDKIASLQVFTFRNNFIGQFLKQLTLLNQEEEIKPQLKEYLEYAYAETLKNKTTLCLANYRQSCFPIEINITNKNKLDFDKVFKNSELPEEIALLIIAQHSKDPVAESLAPRTISLYRNELPEVKLFLTKLATVIFVSQHDDLNSLEPEEAIKQRNILFQTLQTFVISSLQHLQEPVFRSVFINNVLVILNATFFDSTKEQRRDSLDEAYAETFKEVPHKIVRDQSIQTGSNAKPSPCFFVPSKKDVDNPDGEMHKDTATLQTDLSSIHLAHEI